LVNCTKKNLATWLPIPKAIQLKAMERMQCL
jgi:hypothetical protein